MQDDIIGLLAGRRGHFQMESGYHSEMWFELESLFERQQQLKPFISELAKRLAAHGADAVCGPMTAGAKLAKLISAELGIEYFFTERFERPETTGFFPVSYLVPPALRESVRGKSVAIVDDAISAGSAVRGTYTDLLACHARPVALGALFVFGDAADRFAQEEGLALEGIGHLTFGIWNPVNCPLCKRGLAVEKVLAT
jgi:orotate phosphoribosyltransferase